MRTRRTHRCAARTRSLRRCVGVRADIPADVAPFLALPTPPSAQDWRDAADLVAPGAFAAGRYGAGELPEGWRAVRCSTSRRWSRSGLPGSIVRRRSARRRGCAGDARRRRYRTGPFLTRTIELGDYLGIRCDGALVAMAGERFHLDGWTEISAVCTNPDYRGQGLASRLVRRDRGHPAALRARVPACHGHQHGRRYGFTKSLGFRLRQHARLTVVTHEPS